MGTFSRYPGSYRVNWRGLLSPAIKTLLIACTAVFLVEVLVRLVAGGAAEFWMFRWFGLEPWAFVHGRLWQPFTYLFLHGGFWHLFWNMLFLWMFGVDLERLWGRQRFYFYFFLTGVGAGLVNVAVKMLMDPAGRGPALVPTIGASGAIFAVILAAALAFPDREVWLFPFPISLPMKLYAVIMGAIEFFGTLGSSGDGVSHVTHLSGILIGYLFLRRGFVVADFRGRFRGRLTGWKQRRAQRKFEVYMRRHKDEPPTRPGGWVN